jgi:hypothetical protein
MAINLDALQGLKAKMEAAKETQDQGPARAMPTITIQEGQDGQDKR